MPSRLFTQTIPGLTPAATPNARSRSDNQTGSGVHRPQRAEQGQEERSRCLLLLLIRVQSVIAGVAATRSSFGGPLGASSPSGRQPYAAVASGDDRDFPFQFL